MSFAQYKQLLKDEDGVFKVDWIVMSTNLLGVVIVVIASVQARTAGQAVEISRDVLSASLF